MGYDGKERQVKRPDSRSVPTMKPMTSDGRPTPTHPVALTLCALAFIMPAVWFTVRWLGESWRWWPTVSGFLLAFPWGWLLVVPAFLLYAIMVVLLSWMMVVDGHALYTLSMTRRETVGAAVRVLFTAAVWWLLVVASFQMIVRVQVDWLHDLAILCLTAALATPVVTVFVARNPTPVPCEDPSTVLTSHHVRVWREWEAEQALYAYGITFPQGEFRFDPTPRLNPFNETFAYCRSRELDRVRPMVPLVDAYRPGFADWFNQLHPNGKDTV